MGRSLREPVARLGTLSFSRSGGEEGEPDQEPEASSDPPNDHDQNRMPKVISNSSRSGSPDIPANGFATDTWNRWYLTPSPIAVQPSSAWPWTYPARRNSASSNASSTPIEGTLLAECRRLCTISADTQRSAMLSSAEWLSAL